MLNWRMGSKIQVEGFVVRIISDGSTGEMMMAPG